jgi:hypothetical protein
MVVNNFNILFICNIDFFPWYEGIYPLIRNKNNIVIIAVDCVFYKPKSIIFCILDLDRFSII